MDSMESTPETPKKKSLPPRVLMLDDDRVILGIVGTLLKKEDCEFTGVTSSKEAYKHLGNNPVDLVLLDIGLISENGIAVLQEIKKIYPKKMVVMLSGFGEAEHVVQAMKSGACDYLTKPLDPQKMSRVIEAATKLRAAEEEKALIQKKLQEANQGFTHPLIMGPCSTMHDLLEAVKKLKGGVNNIMLSGETGAGKEVFARAIHEVEEDPKRPFIAVNCASISENLVESTLFGHEKGSFTGATEKRIGKFIQADGGDIFLDEIACFSPQLQAKLLRVLQEKEVEPVGSSRPIKVDFRAISATNATLADNISKGDFREDLYWRLGSIHLEVPPLRARIEDIPLLAEYFMSLPSVNRHGKTLSKEVMKKLLEYHWPGNVRELKNVLENMSTFADGDVIEPCNIPAMVLDGIMEKKRGKASASKGSAMKDVERKLIMEAIKRNRWNITGAARDLRMTRGTLYRKMKSLKIKDEPEK